MKLTIPDPSLVLLVGPAGCGKSTFARKHFKPTEVISSDFCRGLVSDDEDDQTATKDAFEVLHFIARKRLARGRLTVVDATNVQLEARAPLVALAREYNFPPVAMVFNLPEQVCQDRNRKRPGRNVDPDVIRQQREQFIDSIHTLKHEGYHYVFEFSSPEEVEAVTFERERTGKQRLEAGG